ncbi:MAG: hypothetical protein HY812_10785 [Planctomycetes bacterium]|nr:hypothetical protein [Planctomycetota bacterium]
MEIRGPDNTHRTDVDRASDSWKAEHPLGRRGAAGTAQDGQVEQDRIDTSASEIIDRSIAEARRVMEEHAQEVAARREELLALADDPEAVRRAAREFLEQEGQDAGARG